MNIDLVKTRWNESLTLFEHANFNLFILASLNTMLRAIKLSVRLFWWLYGLLIMAAWVIAYAPQNVTTASLVVAPMMMATYCALKCILFYTIIMSLRPSLETKQYPYYLSYSNSLWLIALLCIIANATTLVIVTTLLLFFFDGAGTVEALPLTFKRTGRALLYFLPIYAILTLAMLLIKCLSSGLGYGLKELAAWGTALPCSCLGTMWSGLTSVVLPFMINDLLVLFILSATTVYYIKIKHAHFQILFE